MTDTLEIAAASAEKQWTDWQVIHREAGKFTDQPLIDTRRAREEGVLSIYVQESAAAGATSSPLRVIDYRMGG